MTSSIGRSRPSLPEERESGVGYAWSIAGHVTFILLLIFGLIEQIQLAPSDEIPVEVVVQKPPQTTQEDTSAAPDVKPVAADRGTRNLAGLPMIADVDKHADAPRAERDANGVDKPAQRGSDGMDASPNGGGVAVRPSPDGEVAAGGPTSPSRVIVPAPIGPAPPQITTRERGKDELTAIKEPTIECGAKAKRPAAVTGERRQARVRGYATREQALQMIRMTQANADRHINPNYVDNERVFVLSLDTQQRFAVLLPSGLTVNVGDVIEYEQSHVDPSDSCRYIPNLATRKL